MGKLVNETSICFHDYENENSNQLKLKRDLNELPNSCIEKFN